jgi:hypothetical protein
MAMMYGDIDKSREKWNHINLIVKNLTKVTTEWENIGISVNGYDLEKLVQDALESALKLKGDI